MATLPPAAAEACYRCSDAGLAATACTKWVCLSGQQPILSYAVELAGRSSVGA